MKTRQKQLGFTLMEAIVGIAIFVILVSALLGSYTILFRSINTAKEKTILASKAAYYLELVRNMPYESIGTINGNPSGTLVDEANAVTISDQGISFEVFYEVSYVDDPADGTILAGTDVAPTDYKQVKLSIRKTGGVVTNFLTNISPQGLEETTDAGAFYIRVIASDGQPVANADIHIENTDLNPDIILDRTTDSAGTWIEVGLPASVNGFQISVTKTGYSTDSTYPITIANPNPVKPHATVVIGQVTNLAFSIDLVANLTVKTVNSICSGISGVPIDLYGAKLIGTNPSVLKYEQSHTSGAGGNLTLTGLEWDNYYPVLSSSASYTLYGTSPIQEVTVLPGSSQTYTFVLGPSSLYSLRVLVKDDATGGAVEGATVTLTSTSTGQSYNAVTGGSIWNQVDWSGGMGQADFTDDSRYFLQDGNIDTDVNPTGISLTQNAGNYTASGWLESSTFDTGAGSNFTTLSWLPTSQNPDTEIKFQLASNNDNATWNYLGPDGTAGTYYTIANNNISSTHDNDRYIRYKVFLSTNDSQFTPVLTSININYVSGCYTPGQVMFPDLTSATDFVLTITAGGYATYNENFINIDGNLAKEILLTP